MESAWQNKLSNRKTLNIIILSYILIRAAFFWILPSEESLVGDSAHYVELSKLPLSSADFFFLRPFFYPLFIKILHQNNHLIVFFQWSISVLSWLFLAYCIKQLLNQSTLVIVAITTLLLFSCSGYIVIWDVKTLTESLSISLCVLFFGTFLLANKYHFQKKYLFRLGAFGFLLLNIRDANLLFVLAVSCTILLIGLFSYRNIKLKSITLLFFFMLLSVIFSSWTANHHARWLFSFGNILTTRFSKNPSMTNYFINHGMPASMVSSISEISHKGPEGFLAYENNIEGARWIKKNGEKIYLRYLISHPYDHLLTYQSSLFLASLLSTPYLSISYFTQNMPQHPTNSISIFEEIKSYKKMNLSLLLTLFKEKIGPDLAESKTIFAIFLTFFGMFNDFLLFLFPIIASIYFYRYTQTRTINTIFLGTASILLFSSTIGALFIWYADSMEILRHQLMNHLQILLSLFLMSLITIDNVMTQK